MKLWTVTCLALVLGLSLTAQAYLLQLRDAVGTVRTYANTMTMTGDFAMGTITMPIKGTVTFTTVESVTGISADNTAAVISSSQKDGMMTLELPSMTGEEDTQTVQQPMPKLAMTFNRTPQGKVSNLKLSMDGRAMEGSPLDVFTNPMEDIGVDLEFPNRELNIGDTWTAKQSVALGGGAILNATGNYTLAGTEVVNGATCLKIQCSVTASTTAMPVSTPLGPQTMTMSMLGTTTALFDPRAGETVSGTQSLTIMVDMKSIGDDPTVAKTNMKLNGTITKVPNT